MKRLSFSRIGENLNNPVRLAVLANKNNIFSYKPKEKKEIGFWQQSLNSLNWIFWVLDLQVISDSQENTQFKDLFLRLWVWFVDTEVIQFFFSFLIWQSRIWIVFVIIWSSFSFRILNEKLDVPKRKINACGIEYAGIDSNKRNEYDHYVPYYTQENCKPSAGNWVNHATMNHLFLTKTDRKQTPFEPCSNCKAYKNYTEIHVYDDHNETTYVLETYIPGNATIDGPIFVNTEYDKNCFESYPGIIGNDTDLNVVTSCLFRKNSDFKNSQRVPIDNLIHSEMVGAITLTMGFLLSSAVSSRFSRNKDYYNLFGNVCGSCTTLISLLSSMCTTYDKKNLVSSEIKESIGYIKDTLENIILLAGHPYQDKNHLEQFLYDKLRGSASKITLPKNQKKDDDISLRDRMVMHLKRKLAYLYAQAHAQGNFMGTNAKSPNTDYMVWGQCIYDLDNALLALDMRINYKRPKISAMHLRFILVSYLLLLPFMTYPFVGGKLYFDQTEENTFIFFNLFIGLIFISIYTTTEPLSNIFDKTQELRDHIKNEEEGMDHCATFKKVIPQFVLFLLLGLSPCVYLIYISYYDLLFIPLLIIICIFELLYLWDPYKFKIWFSPTDRKNALLIHHMMNESIHYIKYEASHVQNIGTCEPEEKSCPIYTWPNTHNDHTFF
jgi:hypothetical protein